MYCRPYSLVGLLLIAPLLMGCTQTPQPASPIPPTLAAPAVSAAPSPTHLPTTEPTLPPTAPPTEPPTITPTSCSFVYTWAYGTVSPAFAQRVEQALNDAGLNGSVKTSTYGETNGCGEYGAMSTDYLFTLDVARLDDGQILAEAASKVLALAQGHLGPESAPNLGHLTLVFQAGGQSCSWSYSAGSWGANPANGTSGVIECAVP